MKVVKFQKELRLLSLQPDSLIWNHVTLEVGA